MIKLKMDLNYISENGMSTKADSNTMYRLALLAEIDKLKRKGYKSSCIYRLDGSISVDMTSPESEYRIVGTATYIPRFS